MKIPEDLRTWYSVACDKVHFATDYDAIRKLIERIATLTEQLEQARAEIERLRIAIDEHLRGQQELEAVIDEYKADAQRLYEALRIIHQEVTNGRLCYFGDHTGYESQFSSEETVRWSAAIAAHEEK